MAFYELPNPWNPGYAVPKYVQAEPPGRGTFTTKWLPRGTISELIPDYLAKPAPMPSSSLSGHTLRGDSLGATDGQEHGANPISEYGNEAATWIVTNIKSVPAGERAAALKELLGKIDPTLHDRATKETEKLKAQGVPVQLAVQKGLAKAFSEGITAEFVKLGRKGKSAQPSRVSQVALAKRSAVAQTKGRQGLGLTGGHVGLGGTLSFVKDGLSKLGSAACKVATNPLTPAAAGVGSIVAGAPPQVGVAGASIAAAACISAGKGGSAGGGFVPVSSGTPSWVLPAAIGGGILLLVALK